MSSNAVVQCYSGHTYAQEPRAFWMNNQLRTVTVVRQRWREPTGPCFEVLADDARVYVLAYDETIDRWSAFARTASRESCSCSSLGQITLKKEDGR